MYWLILIGFFLLIDKPMACSIPSFANLTVQSNFSLHHFLGIWYEIKWFTNQSQHESDIWNDFSQSFELENNSNEYLLVSGKARLSSEEKCFSFGPWLIISNNSAKMILEKKDLNNTINLNWPYYILKTDYNHYALIYGCMSENYTQNNQCKDPIVWIFSRTVLLSNEYLIELDDYIENILCINLTQFEITLHSEKSCYMLSSIGTKICSMNIIMFFFVLLILYLFLIYK
jgi:lipocalin